MNILIFEHKNFAIEDIEEALHNLGHTYKCITNGFMHETHNADLEKIFDNEAEKSGYDCVFTFNYSPVISNCCSRHNLPYIAFVYDSPLAALYSYTIINKCNHVFLFDKAVYEDFHRENISTVHYMPLAVNTGRLDRIGKSGEDRYNCDISFVGSMYNEKHNFYERMTDLSEYNKGWLQGIMAAQMKVYGYYFVEELLNDDVIKDMHRFLPYNPGGVETESWVYAYYVIARKITNLERTHLLRKLSEKFSVKLFTSKPTPELPAVKNMGAVDYYDMMPYVFKQSKINLNISLRSIRTGIPLRCMDILGAGGFLMSNFQADILDYFIPGEDLAVYDSEESLIKQCDYYLKHEKERQQIAVNGYSKAKEHHTWEIRLDQIFSSIL